MDQQKNEIFRHIGRLAKNQEQKSNIRRIIKNHYGITHRVSYNLVAEYERIQRAKGNKKPFKEVTSEEIIQHYMKSSGARATAKALMVTVHRVTKVVDTAIENGNVELLYKRNSLNNSTVTAKEAKPEAMRFLKKHKGKEFTRNELLDIACKNDACNRFSIEEIKRMALQAGIKLK